MLCSTNILRIRSLYPPWFCRTPLSSAPLDEYKINENLHNEIFHYSVVSWEVIMCLHRMYCFLTDIVGSFISAPGSFLFSLRNKDNLTPFTALLKNENDVNAMYRRYQYGPTFGIGHDFHIADNAISNTASYPNVGGTYNVPPGYTSGQTKTRSLLAGSYYFTPSAVEILYLN